MKHLDFIFLVFCLLLANSVSGKVDYRNPILPYDYSDPDVCCAERGYYMTASSFSYTPGLPILYSQNLVDWQLIDYALPHALPTTEQAPTMAYGDGVWAPSIRYHNGLFYIYYGDPDRGIYCVRGQIGDWQEPVLVMPGKGLIDPCPLWDEDGRVWLVHALAGSRAGLKSVLLMTQLNEDGLSVKTPSRIIFDGHAEHPTCEGPKLYKRNGFYYIFTPAGGVKTGWQLILRSKEIYGPYETYISLQQGKTDVNGPHQGAWIETPQGEHWFYHFQDVGVAGRIVHLQPMRWQNDWPLMGDNGEPVKAPKAIIKVQKETFSENNLPLYWQWSGTKIEPTWYFCDAQHSLLRLFACHADSLRDAPNILTTMIPAAPFVATAKVRFVPNPKLQKRKNSQEQAGLIVVGNKVWRTLPCEHANEWIYLRVEWRKDGKWRFYTSNDGKTFFASGEPFDVDAGVWRGVRIGFYSTRNDSKINDSGWLDIDQWEIRPL